MIVCSAATLAAWTSVTVDCCYTYKSFFLDDKTSNLDVNKEILASSESVLV